MVLSRKLPPVVIRLAAVLAVAVLALGAQLRGGGIAHADGNCGPYQNGLTTYQNEGCVYKGSAPGQTVPPYSKNNGDFVYIDYMIDGGFPTNVANDIQAAVTNWSNSGANIRFQQVYYYDGQPNFLEISPATSGAYDPNPNNLSHNTFGPWNGSYFTSTDCNNDAWGQSWAGPNTNTPYHAVHLNSNLFSQTCLNWDTSWIGVAVHEMGHAFGLAHNASCSYCSSAQPMYARMNANAVHLLVPPSTGTCAVTSCGHAQMVNPQVTDYWIFNQIYPSPPITCASQPSNFSCDGMDPSQQNCVNTAADNQHVNTPYGWVEIWYSAGCKSNWTKAGSYSGWSIYRVQINRGSGSDGAATTIEDAPNATSWYTNLVYSPNNSDESCVSFISTNGATITQWYCTSWH